MNGHLGDAKMHTYLASFFLGAFLVAKLMEKHSVAPTSPARDNDLDNFHAGEAAALGFSVASIFFSWRSTVAAKESLVGAVNAFNDHSGFKIEPAVGKKPLEMPAQSIDNSLEPDPGRK
jgi:hypothetical protein